MATSILPETSRVVYISPEGRVKIVCNGPNDFDLLLDNVYTANYTYALEAKSAGNVWLDEQALQTAVESADIAADVAEAEVIPFDTDELTIADLEAYAAEWDCAVAAEIGELAIYVQEWDAAVDRQRIA